jgi:hypothetical protein
VREKGREGRGGLTGTKAANTDQRRLIHQVCERACLDGISLLGCSRAAGPFAPLAALEFAQERREEHARRV